MCVCFLFFFSPSLLWRYLKYLPVLRVLCKTEVYLSLREQTCIIIQSIYYSKIVQNNDVIIYHNNFRAYLSSRKNLLRQACVCMFACVCVVCVYCSFLCHFVNEFEGEGPAAALWNMSHLGSCCPPPPLTSGQFNGTNNLAQMVMLSDCKGALASQQLKDCRKTDLTHVKLVLNSNTSN